MQLLLIHSDFIEYETLRSTKYAEKIDETQRKGRMEEVLVAFTAVERVDEKDAEEVIRRAAESIKDVAAQVKTRKVLIYPYAHLSQDLSSPSFAVEALKKLESALRTDFEVMRAPFGWYKSFSVKCKGHPLSELSRSIRPEGEVRAKKEQKVSQALVSEEKAKSSIYILTPGGEMKSVKDFDFTTHAKLKKFADYEMAKSRTVDRMPPHVELMKRLGIADHEPGSDAGNLRFYPKGRFVKKLLEGFVTDTVQRLGALEVETPIMYDMGHPTLKSYLDRFPARQYSIESDKKELFLRFAACFGQFLMNKDMVISYRNLPMRMFELTRYSFRREQSGELVGLRRLRAFTMPDMHTLCFDMNQALEEFKKQYRMCIDVLEKIGLSTADYEVGIRFTKDFYEKNGAFVNALVEIIGKPVLVEMWNERFFYFVLKFEFNFIDALDKASALSTVQIDVENAARYGIKFTDADGSEKAPTILHCSPSGAIERCIYALLEKEWMLSQDGKSPMLPVWLSPTQVRLIPVSSNHIDYAEKVSTSLRGIRSDIDDRDDTVGRKIRDASMDWTPYIAVIGDEEVKGNFLTVTVRKESTIKKAKNERMSAEELRKKIEKETAGMPYMEIPLAFKMSLRPKFM